MNRRDLFTGLSGAALLPLAIGAARAQPPTPNAPLTAIGADEYKNRTLMAGTLAKQTSELALQKATNPKVKEFANLEVMEQTAMAQVLTLRADPPPARLDEKHAAVLKELQGASGAEFDKAYVKAQVEGHAELLTVQNSYTTGRGQDTAAMLADDTARIATLAKAAIQTHLTMLKELNDVLRG